MPRRLIVAFIEYAMLFFGLGFLALLCLAWSLFAVALDVLLPERWGRPLGRYTIMAGFRCYLETLSLLGACRFDLCALDALRGEKPLIPVVVK